MDLTPPNTLDAARAYVARGIRVIPVPFRQKGAVIFGWPQLRLAEEDLADCFWGKCNIGVLLGDPSGGLVDIDLDCPEAIELADQFLPPTSIQTGRASTPGSHRWYIAHGATTAQHHDLLLEEDSMIVELRSTGVMTLVGPSIHPCGERYDMLAGEPPVVDAADLARRVVALRDAVLVRRYGHVPVKERPRSNVAPAAAHGLRDVPIELALRRAGAYLDAMPPAISGAGGHNQTYAAATVLVHGFCLSTSDAFELLKTRYNPRCQPPWTDRELRHKVDDAAGKPHGRPKGWLLHAGRADAPASITTSVARMSAN